MALKQVTDASFVDDVLNQKGVVVVDFWAPWCGMTDMLVESRIRGNTGS